MLVTCGLRGRLNMKWESIKSFLSVYRTPIIICLGVVAVIFAFILAIVLLDH